MNWMGVIYCQLTFVESCTFVCMSATVCVWGGVFVCLCVCMWLSTCVCVCVFEDFVIFLLPAILDVLVLRFYFLDIESVDMGRQPYLWLDMGPFDYIFRQVETQVHLKFKSRLIDISFKTPISFRLTLVYFVKSKKKNPCWIWSLISGNQHFSRTFKLLLCVPNILFCVHGSPRTLCLDPMGHTDAGWDALIKNKNSSVAILFFMFQLFWQQPSWSTTFVQTNGTRDLFFISQVITRSVSLPSRWVTGT